MKKDRIPSTTDFAGLVSLAGEPLEGLSTARISEKNTVTATESTEGTIHLKYLLLLLVTKGEIKLNIDFNTYIFNEGSAIHLFPGHSVSFVGIKKNTEILAIAAGQEFMLRSGNTSSERAPDIASYIYLKKNPYVRTDKEQTEMLTREFRRIETTLERNDLHFRAEITRNVFFGYLLELSEIIHACSGYEKTELKVKNRLVNDFLVMITTEKDLRFSTREYAERLCVTPQYLSKILKKTSGKTTKEWRDEMLMARGSKMLLSGKYSVQQTSYILGFPDQSTFGKFFRKRSGMSPSEFIKSESMNKIVLGR